MRISEIMMRVTALTIVAAIAAPVALAAEERSTHGVFLGLDGFIGSVGNSYLRVGEFGERGDTLRFSKDLGVDLLGEGRVRAGYRFDSDQQIQLGLSAILLSGNKDLGGSASFEGTTFADGTEIESRPIYVVPEVRYDRVLFRWGQEDDGKLSADLGLRCDLLDWEFSSATSTGGERRTSEDLSARPLPIPVIGLSAQQPLTRKLDGYAYARGMRVNHWPTFATAGGRVYLSESFVEAGAGVLYSLSASIELSAGYRFLYVDYAQTSEREGNFFKIASHGLAIGLTYYF